MKNYWNVVKIETLYTRNLPKDLFMNFYIHERGLEGLGTKSLQKK